MRRAAVPLLVALQLVLGWTSAGRDACTTDETLFLTGGYVQWRTGQAHLMPESAPLPKTLGALPMLALRLDLPSLDSPDFLEGSAWRYGARLLHQRRDAPNDGPPAANDTDTILRWARLPFLLLLGGLTLLVHATARDWIGPRAALAAALLAATCPNLLAHGRYATADVPVTLGFLGFLWGWCRLLDDASPRNLGVACAFGAFLATAKYSAPLVLPAAAIACVARLRDPAPWPASIPALPRAPLARLAACAAAVAVAAGATIWALCGFRYEASVPLASGETPSLLKPDRTAAPSREEAWRAALEGSGLPGRALGAARDARLLPETYLYGALFTARTAETRGAFLDGRLSTTGFRSFFPRAFLYKTPVGTMALLLLGAAVLVRAPRLLRRRGLLVALAFAATYGAASLASHLNIGHRHLLPVYPVLFLVAALPFEPDAPRARLFRAAAAIALVSAAASGLLAWPNYLAYFNAPSGGPRGGYRHLVDSSLDWGQDLKRLGEYVREHPSPSLALDYEGSANPRYYGIVADDLMMGFADGWRPAPGVIVVSATRLQAAYAPTLPDLPSVARWTPEHAAMRREVAATLAAADSLRTGRLAAAALLARDPEWRAVVTPEGALDESYFARLEGARRALDYLRFLGGLRERAPDARVGASYFVYRLDARDIDALLAPEAAR